ncbi:hypothetical protein [Thalassotalea profundi]|uniref:Phage holin family protein n=1 Tax=Thalassotalea profundi TaxID=2036687 RepID=A0ABQ3J482_9GAMM|nr:hypothetical protein [Thalassotalea profundi]GHF00019.1 hypothetical protein GCM10011501_31810 [Thalassotalea profundi]
MKQTDYIHSSSTAEDRLNQDKHSLKQSEDALSALVGSLEQYLELLIAQYQQTKQNFETKFHLALRALLMSVMALLAFVIVTLCLWFSVSALCVVGLVSLGLHWLMATLGVLIANAGLAWYLLLTSRDLRKSIKFN